MNGGSQWNDNDKIPYIPKKATEQKTFAEENVAQMNATKHGKGQDFAN